MNLIEEKIWDYIDGFCTLEEQEAIKQLITNDPVYIDKYTELMAIEQNMQHLELDEPSMAFTNKLMDKISLQIKPLSASAAIDKRIIYGISALLGFMLLASLGFTAYQVDWSAVSFSLPSNYKIDYNELGSKIQIPTTVKTIIIYSFFMFDIIAGLMLLDRYLRKKMA
jgi:hypothetical protein